MSCRIVVPCAVMRRVTAVVLLLMLLRAAPASAQEEAVAAETVVPQTDPEVSTFELDHLASMSTRRALADAVLVAGLVSLAAGGALTASDAEDQAYRFAGVNTAIFGVVNTIVSLLALHGIAKEEEGWDAPSAAAARRTPGGLSRARVHAALDERREATSHAINLGLGAAYLAVAGTAILASRLGVDHPDRWLGSGVAVGVQALFLVGIDYVGLRRASRFHRVFVEGLAPGVAVAPSASGSETRFSVGGVF